jgi:hypothetical protein
VLGPGEHVVIAELEGYEPARKPLRVAAGDRLRIALVLAPISLPPPEEDDTAAIRVDEPLAPEAAPRASTRLALSTGFGSNLRALGDTGAPIVGFGFAMHDRLTLGIDGVLVAFAAVPAARYRLAGQALSLHAVAAVPISFARGEPSSTFVAAALGPGLRLEASPSIALRFEIWVSYAGREPNLTLPAFAAAELRF